MKDIGPIYLHGAVMQIGHDNSDAVFIGIEYPSDRIIGIIAMFC